MSDVLDLRIFRIRDAAAVGLCEVANPQTWVHDMHASAMKNVTRVRRLMFRIVPLGLVGLRLCPR